MLVVWAYLATRLLCALPLVGILVDSAQAHAVASMVQLKLYNSMRKRRVPLNLGIQSSFAS
jgi:uncharacterized membrane protein